MIARVVDNQWIQLANVSPHEDDVLWREFSVVMPGREYIDPTQEGLWDGVYRFYNRSKQRLHRPLLSKLREVCNAHNLPMTVRDEREPCQFQPLDPDLVRDDFLPGITLDPHQIRAIRAACRIECGIVDIPTGGGKGEIIAGICKAVPCPTVILADQTVVIEQLKDRLELREVVEEAGLFCAGRRPNGHQIAVGTIQSLTPPSRVPVVPEREPTETDKAWKRRLNRYDMKLTAFKTRRRNAQFLQSIVRRAEMIIVDECDKACSDPYKQLFRHVFRGRRRYGLSGTPFDPSKPVENLRVQQHLGSVIARETREKLEAIGRIVPVELIMLTIEGDRQESSVYDIAVNDYIVRSPLFWKMVAGICRRHPDEGTLILVDKSELGFNLQTELRRHGIEAPFIYGKTPKKRRTETIRAFEAREHKVLIGGKIINRGLDLKGGCENLIITTGGVLRSDFIQKIGRAVRHNRNGFGRVYDFYFRCNKYLYKHSRGRLRTMVDIGYLARVVFQNGVVDGASLIRSRFRVTAGMLRAGAERSRQVGAV